MSGQVLVVDASALFDVVADAPSADAIRDLMAADTDLAAPHLIDAEVFSVIQRHHQLGNLDRTAATQAVADLRSWPGRRFSHGLLLDRAWELRSNLRGYDALYVALAERLEATLVTLDERLARAPGPTCHIVVPI